MWMKYDVEEWKIESEYYPTRHVVKFVIVIQFEYIYSNIGHTCCTPGRCFLN